MTATITLPAPATLAPRAQEIRTTWAADAEMPEVHGCAEDAVRVLAVRAALHEQTGDEQTAALAAPASVELFGLVLAAQFPGLRDTVVRSGHALLHGAPEARWAPDDYLHRVYREAFGPTDRRHWPV